MFKVYKKLLNYVPEKKYLAYIAIALSFVSTFLTLAAYFYLYQFLNEIIILNNPNAGLKLAWRIAGLIAAGGVVYFISVLVSHVLGFRLETNLRKRGIDGMSTSSFRFYDLNPSGRTRKLIDDNASDTHNIVAHLIPDNAKAVITPIACIALGFYVNWKVGVVLITITSFTLSFVKLMAGEQKFMVTYQNALENMSSETVEYVRGMPVIKIFGSSIVSFKALYKAITDYSKYALNYSMSSKRPYVNLQWGFYGVIAILIPLILLFMDINKNPNLLAVQLIMTLFLAGVLFASIMSIMYVSMYVFLGINATDKLETLFKDMQSDKLNFGTKEDFNNYDIEFDNVTFSYGENPVFEDLSFKLDEGKSYALVGASGSGKSTIAKLISGFYKVEKGEIKIGGKPIEAYSEEAIIKNIAFVFQDVKLFKTSIYENVQLANKNATREEVMEAMRLAGCDTIISKFKNKENTIIGSKGVYLSGGEKQRIAIARAILKDAKIVIFDEASAAIDPDNEHELQKAFANLMKNRTVIMIAHRLSSIRQVDEIIVLDEGKIVERGTDSNLIKKDGEYKRLLELYNMANDWRVKYV